MKKILLTLILGMFLLSFVSALETLGTFKQGEEIRISQVCSDATYINISSIAYPNSSVAVSNIEMTSAGSGEFYYDFSLTENTGEYQVRGISDGCEGTFATSFEVTLSGESVSDLDLYSDIVLLIVVIGIALLINNKHKNTDFKKGTKGIIDKDNGKNRGQTMAMGIVYSIFKNSFVWMYFLGWIIVLILQDIIYRFNTPEIYTYFTLIANVYSLGLFLVLVFMIGYTISYMKNMIGVLAENSWGVGDGE
jgi:hypothetical protein